MRHRALEILLSSATPLRLVKRTDARFAESGEIESRLTTDLYDRRATTVSQILAEGRRRTQHRRILGDGLFRKSKGQA